MCSSYFSVLQYFHSALLDCRPCSSVSFLRAAAVFFSSTPLMPWQWALLEASPAGHSPPWALRVSRATEPGKPGGRTPGSATQDGESETQGGASELDRHHRRRSRGPGSLLTSNPGFAEEARGRLRLGGTDRHTRPGHSEGLVAGRNPQQVDP